MLSRESLLDLVGKGVKRLARLSCLCHPLRNLEGGVFWAGVGKEFILGS